MLKKIKFLSVFTICLLLIVNSQIVKLEAKERQLKTESQTNSGIKNEIDKSSMLDKITTPNMKEYLTYQNLIYGFATEGNIIPQEGDKISSNEASPGSPFVALKDGEDIIHSIYKYGTGQTTSAVSIYIGSTLSELEETFNKKRHLTQYAGQALINPILNPDTGVITADIVAGKPYKNRSDPLPFEKSSGTAKIYAQQGVIMQEFTYKNEGTTPVVVMPAKQVDTMLGDDDEVPIYTRGAHKGMFMRDTLDSSKSKYRLDYMTDIAEGPIAYAANYFDTPFSDDLNFGPSLSELKGQEDIEIVDPKEDVILFNGDDTAMFMIWAPKTIEPGETYTFRYGVGLKLGADFNIKKTATNQTQSTGLNNVGDIMRFSVDITTKKVVTAVELVENVSEGVSTPTDIQYVNDRGEVQHYSTEEVYDEASRQIKLSIPAMGVRGGELSYKVTIDPKAEGETFVSSAKANAIDNEEGEVVVRSEDFYDLIVEKIPLSNLTVNYLDEHGVPIIPALTEPYKVGQEYKAKVAEIDGFEFDKEKTEGVIEGIMTAKPVTVTFYYNTHQFALNQKVMNKKGQEVSTVLPTETLIFETELTSYLSEKVPNSYYDEFSFIIPVDETLTVDSGKLKLIRKDNQEEVGAITYNLDTKKIKATLMAADKIDSSVSLIVSYQGTIAKETSVNTVIKGNSVAEGQYTGTPIIVARKQIANEVSVEVKDIAELEVVFMNEEEIAKTITRDVKFDTIYDLKTDEDVQKTVSNLSGTYDLVEKPKDEKVQIIEEKNQVIYRFNGILKLYSAPTGLNFGIKGQPLVSVVYQNPKLVGNELIVSDTRVNKGKWRLTAKLTKVLTSESNPDIVRPNAVQYQTPDGVKILNGEETTILTHMNVVSGKYNVSKERWGKEEGFQIKLGRGSIKDAGQYEAKMVIVLENAR